jgi:transposase-like protein
MEKYNLSKNKDKIETTEIKAKARKRFHSLAYKKKILQKAGECSAPGELSALLRREGLSSSTLYNWRKAEANGSLRSSRGPRGPKKALSDSKAKRFSDLEKENYKLKKRIERAEALLDLQKKIAIIMNIDLEKNEERK